jgi:hypothetical protein
MIHPVREWLWGLLFFFVVVAIGGALSAYTFLRYTDISIEEASVSQTHALYNQTLAIKALKLYQSRNDAFTLLKNTESTRVPIVFDIASSTSKRPVIPNEVQTEATTTKSDSSTEGSQLVN